jgi:hypothetical protein
MNKTVKTPTLGAGWVSADGLRDALARAEYSLHPTPSFVHPTPLFVHPTPSFVHPIPLEYTLAEYTLNPHLLNPKP